jgi:hypothetical protein
MGRMNKKKAALCSARHSLLAIPGAAPCFADDDHFDPVRGYVPEQEFAGDAVRLKVTERVTGEASCPCP